MAVGCFLCVCVFSLFLFGCSRNGDDFFLFFHFFFFFPKCEGWKGEDEFFIYLFLLNFYWIAAALSAVQCHEPEQSFSLCFCHALLLYIFFVRLFTCSAPVFTSLPRVSAGTHNHMHTRCTLQWIVMLLL
ncbi:hypothetical protein TCDM_10648 [Trypanosoma cruzi Dm28c]|uniref:Uncharacterized protein n=1 Tax=Trypanosoma cruzi Dm28c TaxID=1416333 RepID=V5B6X6_TRYCR|nr:hypothetical protein TCDM_10648 [Trypanosoma cruzi Dm28c]